MIDAPLNQLESVIREGMAGRAAPADLHATVLQSTLFVPSVREVPQGGEEYQPLILPTPRSDAGMIVVFTDPSRITADATERAPYVFEVAASRFILTLPSNLGIIIFGGPDDAVELDPAALLDMRRTLLPEA